MDVKLSSHKAQYCKIIKEVIINNGIKEYPHKVKIYLTYQRVREHILATVVIKNNFCLTFIVLFKLVARSFSIARVYPITKDGSGGVKELGTQLEKF